MLSCLLLTRFQPIRCFISINRVPSLLTCQLADFLSKILYLFSWSYSARMYQVITSDFVKVSISTSLGSDSAYEKKFSKNITVGDLKANLEMLTGGCAATMKVEVYEKDSEKLVCALGDDSALLGSFPVDDGMRLHVVDSFLLRNSFQDGEKYELTAEEYAQKKGTVRDFLARNKLGKYNEEEQKRLAEAKQAEKEAEEKAAAIIHVGNRCEVRVPGAPVRRATVMYVGEMSGKTGLWVGVKYDEPLGKNDGMVEGKRYFECAPKYGGFTRVNSVTVGDFPEEDFDLDEI